MALPFVSTPHALSVDDVWPAELAQRCVDRANDARLLVDAEHVTFGPEWGEHDVPVVPIAVCRLITPQGQNPARPLTEADGHHYAWSPKGFRDPPRWIGGVANFKVEFRVHDHFEVLGVEVTAELDTATITSTNENSAAPVVVQSSPSTRFIIWLGDSVADLMALTIVVAGRRKRFLR